MRKLLQISSTLNRGAIGVIAEHIGILAEQYGYESYIAHGARYVKCSRLNTIKIGNKMSERMHALESYLFDRQGLGSKKPTFNLIKRIEELQPDIVHIHNLHGYYINYQILFKYLSEKNVPIVWTLHDCWGFTGHCAYFDLVGCEKWKKTCYKCDCKNDYPSSLLDNSYKNYHNKKHFFNLPTNMTLVPVSNWLGDLLNDSFLSGYPYKTIHNGIDLKVFFPCESNLRLKLGLNNNFVILGVANGFGIRKGLTDFIRLQSQLDENFKIILIGVSESDLKKLPSSIIAIRHTESTREMAEFYTMADVFVNPTYEDNYPTTNLEAIACGTPVITYQTGGSPESITTETGFVVNKGDIEALCDIITNMKKEGKANYNTKCREYATSHFDMNSCFMEYIHLYESILKSDV